MSTRIICCAVLLAVLRMQLPCHAADTDWPQWRGPQRSGAVATGPALINAWPAGGLKPLWENKDYSYGTVNGYGSPVIAGGSLYMVYNTSLICLDALTGVLRWKTTPLDATKNASSTPCVVDGRVYVMLNGTPACFDAHSGALIWKNAVIRESVNTSPLVVNGLAVFCGPQQLLAYDALTGKQAWKQPNACTYTGDNGSPACWRHAGKAFIITNSQAGQVCTDAATGEIHWTLPPGDTYSTPVILGDIEIVCAGKSLCAVQLDATKPVKLWEDQLDATNASPTIAGDYVITLFNDNGASKMTCVEWRTGKVAWQHPVVGQYDSPVFADGKLFAYLDYAKTFVMLQVDGTAYHELARMPIDGAYCTSPAIANGKLYLRLSGSIGCYDLHKE